MKNFYTEKKKVLKSFQKEGIDEEILPLVTAVNSHPDIYTTLSCAGHLKLCPGYASIVTSRDDSFDIYSQQFQRTTCDAEWDEFDSPDILNLWCTTCCPPFLAFVCRETASTKQFIESLQKSRYYTHISRDQKKDGSLKDDSIKVMFSFCQDESFDTNTVVSRQLFDQFWRTFETAWKKHITDEDLNPPTTFSMNSDDDRQCYRCESKHDNLETIPKFSYKYKDIDLFLEELEADLYVSLMKYQ